MSDNREALREIGDALAKHFDSLYYVDIETGHYEEMDYVHPDDKEAYNKAVEAVLCGNAEVRPICYRARKADGSYILLRTRGFVLSDSNGDPEYFGGIIIPQ